jgi:hypothetical protein
MKKILFVFFITLLFSFSIPNISIIKTEWINDIFFFIDIVDNRINPSYDVKLFYNNYIEIIKLNKNENSIFVSKDVSRIEIVAY